MCVLFILGYVFIEVLRHHYPSLVVMGNGDDGWRMHRFRRESARYYLALDNETFPVAVWEDTFLGSIISGREKR